jgi:hypothetical protein
MGRWKICIELWKTRRNRLRETASKGVLTDYVARNLASDSLFRRLLPPHGLTLDFCPIIPPNADGISNAGLSVLVQSVVSVKGFF